jgi:Fe/S biogenesis protein NfuA
MTTTEQTIEAGGVLGVTDQALEKVLSIRAGEVDPDTLGLRIEVIGSRGVDYQYDLSLEVVAEVPEGDLVYDVEVEGIGRLDVIIPAGSVEPLQGATLDLPTNSAQGGLVIRNPNRPNPLAGLDLQLEGTIPEKVQALLEASINPSLASHGGFATLVGVDEDKGDVFITMGGGCQGCSMSRMTLTQGIREAVKEAIPEVNEVVDVTDHTAGDSPYYS